MKMIDEFYDFMEQRELIRLRRLAGYPMSEWTNNPTFKEYSFTNVKREHDRTTVLFKALYDNAGCHYRLSDAYPRKTVLLNCALYRYFGTFETANLIGWHTNWNASTIERIIRHGLFGDLKFTSAYIIPAAGRSDPKYVVVCDIISHIWARAEEIVSQNRWEAAVAILKECYGCGSFMAKEVYLDYILATGLIPEDWSTWTPVGPGGKRGASLIRYGDLYKITESEALEIIRDVYAARNRYWNRSVVLEQASDDIHNVRKRHWDLPTLDLTDIQFQCCEFDKYMRVARGDGKPKRKFRPTIDSITNGSPTYRR